MGALVGGGGTVALAVGAVVGAEVIVAGGGAVAWVRGIARGVRMLVGLGWSAGGRVTAVGGCPATTTAPSAVAGGAHAVTKSVENPARSQNQRIIHSSKDGTIALLSAIRRRPSTALRRQHATPLPVQRPPVGAAVRLSSRKNLNYNSVRFALHLHGLRPARAGIVAQVLPGQEWRAV